MNIQQIRTFSSRVRGESGDRRTEVKLGIAWICLDCGEVFTNKEDSTFHRCTREIPYIQRDSV